MTNPIATADLRAIQQRIAVNLEDTTARLVLAESRLRDATRQSVVTGDSSARTVAEAEVATARAEKASTEATLREATRMQEEAAAREAEAARAVARQEIRGLVDNLSAVAAEADTILEAFLAKVTEAQKIEKEVNLISRTKIGPSSEIFGVVMPDAINSVIGHLNSIRSGRPSPFERWHTHAAQKASRRTSNAVGF